MVTRLAPITGRVLEWAVRDRATTPALLADKINVPEGQLWSWILGDAQPTETQLKRLAKELNRPPSFFFLEDPPRISPASVQFRQYAGSTDTILQETLDGITLARKIQKTQVWIITRLGGSDIKLPELARSSSPEDAAHDLREWLEWRVEENTGSNSTDSSVANRMRETLQSKGILALNLTLDDKVTRGFCLHDPIAPLVAVNTRDTKPARLFSYVHELVHLCLGSDSVCETVTQRSGVEGFCNRTAAALLMPAWEFRRFVAEKVGSQVTEVRQVGRIKSYFHVSYRAAAIRAEELGLAGPGLYAKVDSDAALDQKRRGGGTQTEVRDRPAIRVDQYGTQFVSTLLLAESAGLLRRRQLVEMLRVRDADISRLKLLASSGAA